MSGPAAIPPSWPPGTVDAVALAIHQLRNVRGHTHTTGPACHFVTALDEDMAAAALAAAEAVWPHQPPKRDPASTTSASVVIRTQPEFSRRGRQEPDRTVPFGFGRDVSL